jgi:hypothetical protein
MLHRVKAASPASSGLGQQCGSGNADNCTILAPALSYWEILERIQFPDAIIRKLALPACSFSRQIPEIIREEGLASDQGG